MFESSSLHLCLNKYTYYAKGSVGDIMMILLVVIFWCAMISHRSCDLDEWSQDQLDIMKVSGNGTAATFFKSHGVSDSQMQVASNQPIHTYDDGLY